MADDPEDRVLTIPNVISVARLLCIPLFLWLLLVEDDQAKAAILLGVLGATDWVDGYVARHFNQVSKLGKILDPTADRLLLGVSIVAIIIDGSAPRWVALLVLAREIVISIAVLVLAAMGAARIDVTWWGKAGTFCNLWAFPMFLGGSSDFALADVFWVIGWLFAIPGLAFSYYAALLYIPAAKDALRQGREGTPEAVAS
jgi:cardiolipin synthase (CMP-forming)